MAPRYYFEANPLAAQIDSGRHVALFVDFDGTLVPIRKDPSEPCLAPATKGLLESILGSGRSAVTVISGRSLADLRKRCPVRGAYYAGSHGLEILGPGMRFVHKGTRPATPVIDALRREISAAIGACEGVVIEKKRFSFAVHYRAASDEVVSFLRKSLHSKMAAQPDRGRLLTVIRGKKVLEFAPRVSWNKGEAALHIMERIGDGYLPVCLGDDRTDETLFKALSGKGGIAVRVGPSKKTAAAYYVKDQREALLLLAQIDEALRRFAKLIPL
ncbi:MAG: Trehalose-phosphate phosphatase [Syntrophorhabdaceae bacterium PtaU1.Bin034]|nr:MAG: Trehalose-phosphate phosphatase [Syntrophorhabdaceae bacterium PtaU1.Bin034]